MVRHPDPDDLALLAVGEQPDGESEADLDAHLVTCPQCREEVESLRATAALVPLSNFGADARPPGDHVWAGIAAELGFDSAAGAVGVDAGASAPPGSTAGDGATPLPPPGIHPESKPAEGPAEAAGPRLTALPGGVTERRHVSSPPPRRWPRWVAPVAAAVVGVAVGAGAVLLATSASDAPTIEATASLTPVIGGPLPESDGVLGTAELLAGANGPEVRVTAPDLPAIPGAYEVWLFGDDGRMISLGALSSNEGIFTVPQGIDTAEYRVVDVSDEAPDGNPAHSGISVVRGEFA